jgi:competence protein ComEC
VPAIAAIPSLALIAGCAAGLLFPSLPPRVFEIILALSLVVALSVWVSARSALFVGALAAAFFSGGVLLAARAWKDAWKPPLRVEFDRRAREQHESAIAGGRHPTEDDVVPMEIEGVLRSDASPTETGASLSIDAHILSQNPGAIDRTRADGGVLLTVIGDGARRSAGEWRAGRTIRTDAQLRRSTRYFDPGVPDEERLLARRGTVLVGTVKSAALVELIARGSVVSESAAALRAFVRRVVRESVGRWDEQSGAIVTAIVIGDRTNLDDTIQRRLQEAGTYHVIAISGGNIAILAGLTLMAFRWAGVLGRTAMLSAIAGLVGYGYLVGGGASVDRATLMAVIFFAGRAIDQRGPPFNTLAVVAGLLVATNPLTVADPAFLLTFGATAAILAAMPVLASARLPALAAPVVAMVAASAASEAALLPVSAFVFSRVTFAGLALNFAAIPLMAVAQVAGMALVPVALVSGRLAAWIGWVAFAGAKGLVWSANLVRFAPAATWRVAAPGWPVICLYYAGLVAAWALWRTRPGTGPFRAGRRLRGVAIGLGFACAFGSAVWLLFEPWSYFSNKGDGQLHVTFIDVGQGDSAFIRFPRGATLMIDTGGIPGGGSFDIGDRVVAPVLRQAGVHRLQTVAFTHGDNDHIGGATSILREFTPGDVWEGIPIPGFRPLEALHAIASETRTRWTTLQTSDQTVVDEVAIFVRHPELPDWERQHVRNEDSIVLELLWKDVSLVFTGDAGAEAEAVMTPLFGRSPLRIIKVGHHGSPTASTEAFIHALAPRIAVFSVGRSNNFGHPSPVVLNRYRQAGAEIFRTDQDGAITLDTDGHSVHVSTFTGRRKLFESR